MTFYYAPYPPFYHCTPILVTPANLCYNFQTFQPVSVPYPLVANFVDNLQQSNVINNIFVQNQNQKDDCEIQKIVKTSKSKLQSKQVRIDNSEESQSYNPEEKDQKPKNISKSKQKINLNKNRNVKQSLVQQFFSFLHNQRKSRYYVYKICSLMNLEHDQKRVAKYYIYFKNLKANLQKSLKEKNLLLLKPKLAKTQISITDLNPEEETIQIYKNIARRLAHYFYSMLLPIRVVTSKKLRKSNDSQMIEANLKMRREILMNLNEWFSV